MRRDLLQGAAEEAFNNSRDLLEESKLLYTNSGWARSYLLAVTAAEQYVLSFEFKCNLAGFDLQSVWHSAGHTARKARFALLIITPYLMEIGAYNFFAKMAGVQLRKPDLRFLKRYINTFQGIQGKRNAALYVDLNGTLSVPSKIITKDDALRMIEIMNPILKAKPKFLLASDDDLQRTLGMGFLPVLTTSQSELFRQIGKIF